MLVPLSVVAPPPGSELIDDWYLYWALAERLGLSLSVGPHRILAAAGERDGPVSAPSTEELLRTIFAGSRVPTGDRRELHQVRRRGVRPDGRAAASRRRLQAHPR